MDTTEHTELGNGIRLDSTENNPYLRIDEAGVLHLRLQRFNEKHLPIPMELEMSSGEIVAMAGDYFTQADWIMELDLPKLERFNSPVELGNYLIRKSIGFKEEEALIKAYNNLAAPDVSRKDIDLIYKINDNTYIPGFPALDFYVKQLMFYFRVKDYGEMLTTNQTHFTPWSVRVYVLGHSIALRYAHLAYELNKWANTPDYQSDNPDFHRIRKDFAGKGLLPSRTELFDLAHRYHAQALSMELFTFHYYTDHFATGHMAMVGDLRKILPERFGTLGSILANNLHDEINRVGVFTIRPYDPTPDERDAPTRARGDGDINTCLDKFNRQACADGMAASIQDIQNVLHGAPIPQHKDFGGLEHMPDVDFNSRQHQPLLVLSNDRIFYRKELSKIHILSPTEYEGLRANPLAYGYKELTSTWDAFKLVAKLRLLPFVYEGKIQPVSSVKKIEIMLDEQMRSPKRQPIPEATCDLETEPTALDWRTKKVEWSTLKDRMDALDGLKKHSVLKMKRRENPQEIKEPQEELSLGI
ncbi:type IV secretion protein Dot [uncultured Legionella sp.]|uniref:type IV secretion protein Dot n=1 Tax=uncultured Legionella sp. TaxID=210934 RepID=UPI00261F67AB|nr:type IV secretion protein Dot [uncultured Legionella sp.]